jgi:hypothetical protein
LLEWVLLIFSTTFKCLSILIHTIKKHNASIGASTYIGTFGEIFL